MNYKNFLKKNIFKTDEFNQFNLMIDDFNKINKLNSKHIAILERTFIYSGYSIFSPLILSKKVSIIDYNFKNMKESRKGYQLDWIKNTKYKFIKSQYSIKDCLNDFKFSFKSIDCDFLMIPNVLHHCSDFTLLIKKIIIKFPNLKYIYIFDSPLREIHQYPYDFARHTPSSIENILIKSRFKKIYYKDIGNAFDVLLYFISQSKKILSNNENIKIKKQIDKIVPILRENRNLKKWQNLGRKHAKLYSAYSMIFKKN